MDPEIAGIILTYLCAFLLAVFLGRYIAGVLSAEPGCLDRLFNPLDHLLFKLSGIDPRKGMSWKENLGALLAVNLVWFLLCLFVLCNMDWLLLNPDHNPAMSADLAFNTAVSFVTNTNLQHYAGESGLSYLGQLVLMVWQFLSAGCGIAICAVLWHHMRPGLMASCNFFYLFVRACTRILLPIATVLALILVFEGVPMTFTGKAQMINLEGDTVQVSRGPVAAFVAIKQVGSNGGGFFGPNSAHPLENPSYLSNAVESMSILLIPMAMVFAMGHFLRRRRLARMIFGVMSLGFLLLLLPALFSELGGNPALSRLGISQLAGSMEGKETRLGAAASATWAVFTTCTSNGSVNAMHDSMMPLAGMSALLGMLANCFYGGVGVGLLNFYVFIILAVFISGLMVGRTPEFLGRKIEAREMKIALLVALLHPLLILGFSALAAHLYAGDPQAYAAWLSNPGPHGFSQILYESTSSSANNGSGFEGLGDNTPFWNIGCAIIMLLSRYLPIIGPLAIAGLLSAKKHIPDGAGTLRTDTLTFGCMVFAVIVLVAALSFFPALTLGPIAEYGSLYGIHL